MLITSYKVILLLLLHLARHKYAIDGGSNSVIILLVYFVNVADFNVSEKITTFMPGLLCDKK